MTLIDMEMPIDCCECRLRYSLPTIENDAVHVCCATRKEVDLGWVDRPCWCPLTDGKKQDKKRKEDKKRIELLDKETLIRHATQDGAYEYISAHEIEEMEPASITDLLLAVQEWLMEHPEQYLVLNRDEDGNQWFSVKTRSGADDIIDFEVR